MRLLISAGEASGEMYGAGLLEALRAIAPAHPELNSVECFGLGGERMRAAGCETVVDAKDVAVVGIFEVLSHLPTIYRRFHHLVREAERRHPDVAVLIDFPDFNFRLAKELHARRIPVVYYVSPQLWAWRPKRIELVKRYVNRMLVIFPFEEGWYRERGVAAEFTGHPLVSSTLPNYEPLPLRDRARRVFEHRIALLPGSRIKEVRMNLPVMLHAASLLKGNNGFVLPVASTLDRSFVENYANGLLASLRQRSGEISVEFVDDAREALAHAHAAVVASGTATVEAAVIGTPFVMVYRLAPLTYALGKNMVKVPFYAMPNLIAGRQVVPELVQHDFTAERVAAEIQKIIPDGPARQQMLEGFAEVRKKLRGAESASRNAFERAAEAVINVANEFSPSGPKE